MSTAAEWTILAAAADRPDRWDTDPKMVLITVNRHLSSGKVDSIRLRPDQAFRLAAQLLDAALLAQPA